MWSPTIRKRGAESSPKNRADDTSLMIIEEKPGMLSKSGSGSTNKRMNCSPYVVVAAVLFAFMTVKVWTLSGAAMEMTDTVEDLRAQLMRR